MAGKLIDSVLEVFSNEMRNSVDELELRRIGDISSDLSFGYRIKYRRIAKLVEIRMKRLGREDKQKMSDKYYNKVEGHCGMTACF